MSDENTSPIPYIIVGGGLSGLLTANLFHRRGIAFLGIERAEVLGGRSATGHHRLYSESSVELFKKTSPELTWKRVDDTPKIRKKGQWAELESEESFGDDESFYLKSPFYAAENDYTSVVEKLAAPVRNQFEMRRSVISISPDTREIECQDGRKLTYENLIWCNSLEQLNKIWKGDRAPLQKVMKKGNTARGGIDFEWEVTSPIVPSGNTVIFPFRFKEHKLRALGVQEETSDQKLLFHLMLFLDEEISEDREEVAKCLRALRREFEKEFPEIKEKVKAEKIVFVPEISGETAAKAKSLEIVPHLYYVGPQLQISDETEALKNLDRVATNCSELEKTLWGDASHSPVATTP